MCIVSNIGDGWGKSFPDTYPQTFTTIMQGEVSRFEFDALRAQNAALRAEVDKLKNDFANLVKLLKLGKALDEATGQPDCEMDEKIELIRRIADAVGVDLEDVLGA